MTTVILSGEGVTPYYNIVLIFKFTILLSTKNSGAQKATARYKLHGKAAHGTHCESRQGPGLTEKRVQSSHSKYVPRTIESKGSYDSSVTSENTNEKTEMILKMKILEKSTTV